MNSNKKNLHFEEEMEPEYYSKKLKINDVRETYKLEWHNGH